MNPKMALLQPYPFERLKQLLKEVPLREGKTIDLSVGEPKHSIPDFVQEVLTNHIDTLQKYPTTIGELSLRMSIAKWLGGRYGLRNIDPETQVLPVNGSREALFSFAQAVLPGSGKVICPNPFYQIYEGAALLAGAEPYFAPQTSETGYRIDWSAIPEKIWRETHLVYVCSPSNPTGNVMSLADWQYLLRKIDQYGFILASDECYSEIYLDENAPPIGALQAAQMSGWNDFRKLVVFASLSKRSSLPGLRSGFVAGDAQLLKQFVLYRTYHGSAMSPLVQAISTHAWSDEKHVRINRELYRKKFGAVLPLLDKALEVYAPAGGFYVWGRVPGGDDLIYCRNLRLQHNVLVLPGSFLSRPYLLKSDNVASPSPGEGFVRIALVENLENCISAAKSIADFTQRVQNG